MPDNPNVLSGRRIRILIVDDHPLVREGLALRIASDPELDICGEADSVATGLAQAKATCPDLMIIDIQLKDSHGLDLIKQIHKSNPATRMLVVSAFDESLYAERALRAGAHGYINKRELHENVLDAVKTVIDGKRYLSPAMTQQMLRQAIGSDDATGQDLVGNLSNRELEVFQLIGRGIPTGAIAKQLKLSVHTIDTHREKIRHKLGISNSAQLSQRAVQWVLENG